MVLSFEKFNESRLNESALQDEYKAFFKEVLAKYDVNSPMKLSKEDKSKFFAEVKAGWVKGEGRKNKKKVNENNIEEPSLEESLKADYKEFYKETLAKYDAKDLGDLSKEDQEKFYADIEEGWEEGKGRTKKD